ncbi:AraC family transcriptional regulator [Streptomyces sp. NPDC093085]|uniref:AraC family transcriptional regulator n=1 Tax=Streptomyces sp. NPDC093085 TaxID=3155068 RepID=UPI00343A6CA2
MNDAIGTPQLKTELLAGHRAFTAHSPEAASTFGSELIAPHRVALVQRDDPSFVAAANAMRLRDTTLAYLAYEAEVEIDSEPLETLYAANVTLSGEAVVWASGHRLRAGPGDVVVFNSTGSTKMRWSRGFSVLSVLFSRVALERHLARMTGASQIRRISFESMTAAGHVLHQGHAFVDFAQLGARTGPVLPVVTELERAIMTNLLLSQPHNMTGELLGVRPAAASVVDRALEVIHSCFAEPLSVSTIAERVGVGERALQSAFQKRFGRSPMTYLREVRLDRVRQLLLESASDVTVAEAASDCGFQHLGRFAAHYRAHFGELPSTTPRRT